jgi:hypothetical protein
VHSEVFHLYHIYFGDFGNEGNFYNVSECTRQSCQSKSWKTVGRGGGLRRGLPWRIWISGWSLKSLGTWNMTAVWFMSWGCKLWAFWSCRYLSHFKGISCLIFQFFSYHVKYMVPNNSGYRCLPKLPVCCESKCGVALFCNHRVAKVVGCGRKTVHSILWHSMDVSL